MVVEYVISLHQKIQGIAYLASSSWVGVRVAILKADGVAGHLTHKEKGREEVGGRRSERSRERGRQRGRQRQRQMRGEVGEGSPAIRVGHFEWDCLRDKCHFHLCRGWTGANNCIDRRLCDG